jgi:integrase
LSRKGSGYLFHDAKGNQPRCQEGVHGGCERAGLRDVLFKDLRRTFATMCVLRGVKPRLYRTGWVMSNHDDYKYYVISPEDHEQEEIKRLDGMSGRHL